MRDADVSHVLEAVRQALMPIRWKAGKAASHLTKRIRLGHLPVGTSLDEYNAVILVMIGMDSVMETAFPLRDPTTYLADPAYSHLGRLQELWHE